MLSVRPATIEDLTAAVELFQGYLRFYEREHALDAVRRFLRERLAGGDSIIYLAFDEQAPIGLAQVYPTFSSLSLARSWVLNDLFVDPEARGTGAGRALLRAVTAAAARAGAAYVALETAELNRRAQGLYESEGFTVETGNRHYTRTVDPARPPA
jgi:ribosomal protein S18 acetylase RimI-like enzyme